MTSTLAQGVGRSPGESVRPLRALAASPALIVLLARRVGTAANYRIRALPVLGLRDGPGLLRLVGPDAGRARRRRLLRQRRASLTTRPPTSTCSGPSACSPGPRHPTRRPSASDLIKLPPILLDLAVGLRHLPARAGLGLARPAGRGHGPARRPRSTSSTRCPSTTRRSGARATQPGALVAAARRGGPHPRQQRGRRGPGRRWPRSSSRSSASCSSPWSAFVLIKRHLVRPGSGPRHAPWAPQTLAAWLTREQGPLRLLTAIARRLGRLLRRWRCPSAWAPTSTSSACSGRPAATPT